MHVVPFAHLTGAFDVVVGHVHATRIGHLAINDDNLAMIAAQHMVDPRKGDGVKFVDFNTFGAYRVQVMFLQWTVVRRITKSIKQSSYLHTLSHFLFQDVEQQSRNGIVSKVEVLQMHATLGLLDGQKQVIKLLLSVHQQRHTVVM